LRLTTEVEPKQTTGIVEAIRQLRVARDSAVKSRSVAMLRVGDLILTAPSVLRAQLATRKTLRGQATLCRRLRPDTNELGDPIRAAKAALRSLARRIALLDEEIAELDALLQPLFANRGAAHDRPAGHLHRARWPATDHRRSEHRPPPRRRRSPRFAAQAPPRSPRANAAATAAPMSRGH
jgi:hypothetical protein